VETKVEAGELVAQMVIVSETTVLRITEDVEVVTAPSGLAGEDVEDGATTGEVVEDGSTTTGVDVEDGSIMVDGACVEELEATSTRVVEVEDSAAVVEEAGTSVDVEETEDTADVAIVPELPAAVVNPTGVVSSSVSP
jgi:hypothetical protein